MPSTDLASASNQYKVEAIGSGKLPIHSRTKNSSADLFEFSEILMNERRQNYVTAAPGGQRQMELTSDMQREVLNFPSDLGVEVCMPPLECTGGSGGTSHVTQNLYD